MSLKFLGDWNPWVGAVVALVFAALAWVLYRRETRTRASALRWILPLLRTGAIVLAILMLTGPVLHHRDVVGERGRVLVFVDASRSMGLTDEPMEPARKLLAAQRLGWLPASALDTHLVEAADALARARRAAGGENADPARWRQASAAFAEGVEAAGAILAQVRAETGGAALERKGVILREVWTGVNGGSIAELKAHPAFPHAPDGTSTPDRLEAPTGWGDNYGTRMVGFLHPPATGNYTFWIAGDDQCELWLSPDGDPGKKQVVARVAAWSPPRAWDTTPEQKSAPVRLTAGQKCYVEVLHKEGTGEDAVAVGWQLPDGKMERPVPGTRLSAPTRAAESPGRALEALRGRFTGELLDPARALADRRGGDAAKAVAGLQAAIAASSRWERELREAFENYASRVAASGDETVAAAIRRFDGTSRHGRVEEMLIGGEHPLLKGLAGKHKVEILALADKDARPVWGSAPEAGEPATEAPKNLPLSPEGPTTNLADGVKGRIGEKDEERVAVVVVSDGQHNEGGSPLAVAKMLGQRQIPVYAVGVGSTGLPEDLALLGIKSPASVFHKDRVKGEIQLKDDMPAGRPFTVKIEAGGQVVWEKTLTTEQSHLRSVPFDFPIQSLVEQADGPAAGGVTVLNRPLSFKATLGAVDGEREQSNNDAEFSLHALMQRRRVLILDGRARWETRYLRNAFERDEQWDVNVLMADAGAAGWGRGKNMGQFPGDRETLFTYDMVVFGEVPRQLLKMEELEWLRDFVGKRGGGMLVIDGRRGHVAGYADSPMGPLFPVDWKGVQLPPSALKLTDRGARLAMLSLAGEPEKNAEVWAGLRPPHWTAPARALPGAEVLVEAVAGERRVPALVYRRFGAGKVLYAGFDETWRWRYEVADLHHLKYWNQVVREIMEPPFTVRDERASLHVGKLVHGPDEPVEVRARLRTAEGLPHEGQAEALVYNAEGRKVATVALAQDENAAGLFRGSVKDLPGGTYQVRVRPAGAPEPDGRLSAEFRVRSREAGELAVLNANEEVLRQMAAQSGGEFFREEEVRELATRLEPLSRERILEHDTVLWQSWWWFVPLVALLSVEWAVRKWVGML